MDWTPPRTCTFVQHVIKFCGIFSVFLVDARTFRAGVLLPVTGSWPVGRTSAGAVTLALDHVNSDPTLTALRSGGHRIEFVWRDTQCDIGTGLTAMMEMKSNTSHPVDVFIGPACDEICSTAGILASHWTTPMISYGCVSPLLSNKTVYPTFARTSSVHTTSGQFILAIMQQFGWGDLVIMTSADQTSHLIARDIKTQLREADIQAEVVDIFRPTPDNNSSEPDPSETFRRSAATVSNVFLLVTSLNDTHHFLEMAALNLDLAQHDYVFISFLSILAAPYGDNVLWRPEDNLGIYEGLLDISFVVTEEAAEMAPDILAASQNTPFYIDIQQEEQIDPNAYLLYDAILLYAEALNACLEEDSDNVTSRINEYLFNRTFSGTRGNLTATLSGDTQSDLVLRNVKNGTLVTAMEYTQRKSGYELHITDSVILWPNGRYLLDTSSCEWDRSHCDKEDFIIPLIVVIFTMIAVIISIGVFKLCLKRKRAKNEGSLEWILQFDSFQMFYGHSSATFKGLKSEDQISSFTEDKSETMSVAGNQQMFSTVYHHQGKLVSVKKIDKPFIYVTKDIIKEMNEIRRLSHVNLNPVVGACVEPQHVSIVTEYCSKGSLQDVLENENIKLDRIFTISFATDIAEAMCYLHQSNIKCHGRLKSSNVLVDSRWACKVTDFGMRLFREGEKTANEGEHAYYYRLLWTAPEHLRQGPTVTEQASQKGDVYAFAIVLQEIFLRSPPFNLASESPEEVVERVRRGGKPPYRPKVINDDNDDDQLVQVMKLCWEEIPAFRPNFNSIKQMLNNLSKGRQTSLVDQMMHMMEKYADHLEDLVNERTGQLAIEQKKTEELLSRMLPRFVTEQLKQGLTVPPEYFDSVTVFFSDVVGFTLLASDSSPLEVVDFLNDLYTCFDTVIEHFNVYKVETIGDAYMVASGLPERNGDRHAGEICTMALDVLSEINAFVIRHRPSKQLQLRIGIHSGGVAAGVVGIKMPRYCLFGDTVNYASRMESSGLALRVHVSSDCKQLLDKLGGFHMVERGMVSMKGKGEVFTYFLTGKDGFDKVLPDLSKAAPESDHTFK